MTAEAKPDTLPAYISFKTLLDMLKRMRDEGEPTMIDRSYLDNYSGGYQSQILSSLEWLGLIENGRFTEPMKTLIRGTDQEQRDVMSAILLEKYPRIVELGESNTTQKQFEDALRELGPKGETLRKAGAFYLHAAKFTQAKISPLWKTPPSTRKRRITPEKTEGAKESPTTEVVRQPASDAKAINLPSGETLALTMSAPLLSLKKEEREFVLSLVDQMEEYEAANEAEAGADDEDFESWVEEDEN